MTATVPRLTDAGRLPVHDGDGRVIAMVGQARSEWLGWLLAECDRGHCYVIDGTTSGCPVCTPGGREELSDGD